MLGLYHVQMILHMHNTSEVQSLYSTCDLYADSAEDGVVDHRCSSAHAAGNLAMGEIDLTRDIGHNSLLNA